MSLPDGRHFKVSEFACHDALRTPYPEDRRDEWLALIGLWDAIRDLWGGPIKIVSGYRTPTYNAALIEADAGRGVHGVASSSKHMTGEAADGVPEGGGDASMLYRVVMAGHDAGKLAGLGGIGLYAHSNWVHCDIFKAPDGHLRKWVGV